MPKKRQKLTICLVSKVRDCFGVWETTVTINDKLYTYPIDSEFALRKIEQMIRTKKFGKALYLLSLFKIEEFNYFKEEVDNGR